MATSTHTAAPFKTIDERVDTAPPHPGEILREDVLPHFGLSIIDAAWLSGLACADIESLLMERTRITPETAQRLDQAFGLRQGFWLALQLQFDLWQAAVGPASPNRYDQRPGLERDGDRFGGEFAG